MLYSNKIITCITLSVFTAMYGGPEDGWIVVGPKQKKHPMITRSATSIIPTKNTPAKLNPTVSVNAAHIPSLASQAPINKKKSAPCKTPALPKHTPHVPTYHQTAQPIAQQPYSIKKNTQNIPLHMAALHNDVLTIDGLIQNGIDIDALDEKGATALHWAAGNGKTAAVEELLKHEEAIACLGIQDDEGKTPLHRAAGLKSNAIIALVRKTPAEYLELKDQFGSTALLWAVSGGNLRAVKAFIRRGANVNAQDNFRGRTPLLWALRMSSESVSKGGELMPAQTSQDIIKYLMEHGADPKIRDKKGFSAHDWAYKLNRQKEISLLENNPEAPRRSERLQNRK